MSFSLDLSKFRNITKDNAEVIIIKSFLGLTTDATKDIAVDEGRARNSFFPAINKFSTELPTEDDKSGLKSIARVKAESNKFRLGDTLTWTSNLPYIKKIEFGLFMPKDSKKVTGGFSNKSPAGFLGRNVTRWQEYIDTQARKVK